MNIAIFGATGLIGRKFIQILNENSININPKLYASKKSVGKKMIVNHKRIMVEEITEDVFKNINCAFFFVPSNIAKELSIYAKKYNVTVIDNSSCFRLFENVPLVIPEINKHLVKNAKYISNPNCTTIQAVLPLFYLDQEFILEEVNFSTYQSLSGGGNKLLNTYKNTSFESVYPFIGNLNQNLYTDEEEKMILETKKILNKKITIRAICVRTKAKYCHGCYVDARFKKELDLNKCLDVLNQKRIHVLNDISNQKDKDDILITRLRKDIYDSHRLQFFCLADNLRVGAAYNSYLIAKELNIF